MKVTMISLYDYADSGKRIMHALSLYTGHECGYVCIYDKSVAYPPIRKKKELTKNDIDSVEKADVIIYKGDELLTTDTNGFIQIVEKQGCNDIKRKVIHHYTPIRMPKAKRMFLAGGGGFRRLTKGDNTNTFEWFAFSEYKFDMLTTISPEMAYPEISCKHLGYTIDSENMKNVWRMTNPLRIYAYDSLKAEIDRKGVRKHLLPVINRLKQEGYKLELVVAKNLTYQENLKLKATTSICFENIAEYGCFGNSGVESLAMGIPMMCFISDESIAQAGYNYGECVFNVKNQNDVYNCLKSILEGKIDLAEYSQRSKKYCDMHHSYKAIASKLNEYLNICINS